MVVRPLINAHLMAEEKKASWLFNNLSGDILKVSGSPVTFLCALLIVLIWGIAGPFCHFSDTWHEVMNTGITIITFFMVFVIQQAQNKDTMSLQMKLNELIAATKGASNRVINIEEMSEEELKTLKKFYAKLSDLSEKDGNFGAAHSVDEAKKNEAFKEAQ
jgi:low affinity Fe/Cu permease